MEGAPDTAGTLPFRRTSLAELCCLLFQKAQELFPHFGISDCPILGAMIPPHFGSSDPPILGAQIPPF